MKQTVDQLIDLEMFIKEINIVENILKNQENLIQTTITTKEKIF